MAKIQFLTILLVVTCFLGGVVSVTDKEFEDFVTFVYEKVANLDEHSKALEEQSVIIKEQSVTIMKQTKMIERLRKQNRMMMEDNLRQDHLIEELTNKRIMTCELADDDLLIHEGNLIQNATIEERVALLEIQVVEIQEDVTGLDQDVNFLFDEQVIQDERIFTLEQTTDAINAELVAVDDELESLLATTITLDFRVTTLEENGGSDGNSSVAELEVRVETLEGTAADHETRISATEININDLEGIVADHETRLTATEENIQGLQMTDDELDERVTALEENGGSGDTQNNTIAFYTVLTSYSNISEGSSLLFNYVLLNQGDGYNSSTGTFTVPPGGDGYYYFSTNLVGDDMEIGFFDIEINGDILCTVRVEQQADISDFPQSSCGAAVLTVEGDEVQVVYRSGTDMTPLIEGTVNGFTGFRI